MSTLTKNLNLTKPDAEEFYDVQVQNENMDIIDEEITKAINNPTLDEILALLENTTYGLNALKNLLGTGGVDLTPVTSGLSTVNTNVSTVQNTLNNSTYGLNAIKNAVNGRASESTLTATKALLENGTYGLSALKNTVGLGCVKSVQRGVVNGSKNGVNITINAINPNKAVVLLDTSQTSNGSSTINTPYVTSLTSTVLSVAGGYYWSGSEFTISFGWQVIEFY